MTPLWWSILLAVIGIIGILVAGRKSRWGWAIGFAAQFLWIVFAIVTAQYGFILSAVGYGAVYALNWWKWRAEKRKQLDDPYSMRPMIEEVVQSKDWVPVSVAATIELNRLEHLDVRFERNLRGGGHAQDITAVGDGGRDQGA